MRGHLTRLGALLLLLFAVGLPAANAQAPGFTQCTIDQPHGGIVIKANSQTAQGYGGGNLPTNVLTVAVPKGQTPKVVIGCDAYKYLLTIPGVGTENADPVKNVGLSVPVTTGTNTVTLQFTPKDPKSKTEQPFTHTLTFQAWVYTIEPWGQIDRPFQGSFESEWMTPELTDAAGNLYVRLGARRKVGAKYEFTAGLARVAPGGKLTLYQISPTGAVSTDGADFRKLVVVDKDKNLYAEMKGNIVQFDATGKFVRSLGALGMSNRVTSFQDLAPNKGLVTPGGKSSLNAISYFDYGGSRSSSAVLKGAIYLLGGDAKTAGKSDTLYDLVRFTLDGKLTVLAPVAGPGTKYKGINGLAATPEGTLVVVVSTQSNAAVLLTYGTDGKLLKETPIPPEGPRSMGRLRGIDSEGHYYAEYCNRVSKDLLQVGMPLDGLRFRKKPKTAGLYENPPVMDQLTNAEAQKQPDGSPQCLVDGDTIYISYPDRQVAKFALQRAGAPTVAAAAPPSAGPRVIVRRTRGMDFSVPVGLDGQTPVDFEAVVTDAGGKPLAGVTVDLKVVDTELPRRGTLTLPGGPVTNANGMLWGRYVPPKVEAKELDPRRSAPMLGFQATARLQGQAALEANENCRAVPVSTATIRLSRVGYATADKLPATLPNAEAGVLTGSVVAQFGLPGTGNAGAAELKAYPVAGAYIELLGEGESLLGSSVSGPDGTFRLEYGSPSGQPVAPPFALATPMTFTALEPKLDDEVRRFVESLNTLAGAPYGYMVGPMSTVLRGEFLKRLAAAADDSAALIEVDNLDRVALLSLALLLNHKLVNEAAARLTDSLEDYLKAMVDLLNPLDKVTVHWKSVGRDVRDAVGSAFENTPLRQQLARRLLGQLWLALSKQGNLRGVQGTYEATVWAVVKSTLTELAFEGGKLTGYKERLVGNMSREYTGEAQKELFRAATAWQGRTLPYSGPIGPMMRSRYADQLARYQAATARQLNLELSRADIDLGFNLIGNSVKIIATVYASPAGGEAARETVEMMEKGFKALNVGLETVNAYLYLTDIEAGYAAARQFAKTALETKTYCFGDGC